MKIAICDDQPIHLEKIAALLGAHLCAHPAWEGQISVFESGQALLKQAEAQHGFDLYLLDILMSGPFSIR